MISAYVVLKFAVSDWHAFGQSRFRDDWLIIWSELRTPDEEMVLQQSFPLLGDGYLVGW